MKPIDTIPDPSDLPVMSQGDLDRAVEKHARFTSGQIGGARLVLQYQNISGLDFRCRDISQADLTACLLVGADLGDCNCTGTSFFACDLRNANLRDANLSRTDFRGAYVAGADLSGANLSKADMRAGKIMMRSSDGMLTDRKRSGGDGAVTVFKGAKMARANLNEAQAANADFTDADLSRVDMRHADLSNTLLTGANLTDADMQGTDLTAANMRKCVITGTLFAENETRDMDDRDVITDADTGSSIVAIGQNMSALFEAHTLWVATGGASGAQLDLSGYDLRDVEDLRTFPLTAIEAVGTNFLGQDLRGAEMQSANFDRADFRDCRMSGADVRGSRFKYAMLTRADFSDVNLSALEFQREDGTIWSKRVDMSGANMRHTSFEGADLRDCILMGADLSYANLRGCDLRRADLTGALLQGADLIGARVEGAQIDLGAV